jgi:hypothetical protein
LPAWWALVGLEAAVDLIRDAPAQRPDGLGLGVPGGDTAVQVIAAGASQPQLGDGNAMHRRIQLPVTAPVRCHPRAGDAASVASIGRASRGLASMTARSGVEEGEQAMLIWSLTSQAWMLMVAWNGWL